MAPEVRILEDAGAVARAAAAELCRLATAAVAERDRFTVALSGGSTPRLLFREVASAPPGSLPWEKVHLFWGDERTVPPDHPDSNFRMAHEELLSRVAIPTANIHRMRGEDPDPVAAAADYEADLLDFFGLRPRQLPRFDLVLLGMGVDGHTASLFPGSEALLETERLVAAPWIAQLGTQRLTLAARVFNQAACVVFLVSGGDKAATLKRVLEGPRHPLELPSQLVAPGDGELVWLIDTAAARHLSPRCLQRT
jgi:6-phosphogluconolactonase